MLACARSPSLSAASPLSRAEMKPLVEKLPAERGWHSARACVKETSPPARMIKPADPRR